MFYLINPDEIRNSIRELADYPILWLDTEIADYLTPYPKLSLIQALAKPDDLVGDSAYILDVLHQSEIVEDFINQIMKNAQIEKVFHNAGFDLKYLGKTQAKNVTCTYKIARKISREALGTSNLKLKTLAKELCNFSDVDAEEGASDWGRRPLSQKQLDYAKMDTVYLAQLYLYLDRWKASQEQLSLDLVETILLETTSSADLLPDSTPQSLCDRKGVY